MSKMTIDVYSHSFVIRNMDNLQKEFVDAFSKQHNVHWAWIRKGKRNVKEKVAVYATATRSKSEIRLYINQLESFLTHLAYCGVTKSDYDIFYHNPDNLSWPMVNLKFQKGWKLREIQERAVAYCTDFGGSAGRTKLVAMVTGTGKAQPLYSAIATPSGFKTMGDMKVGEKVLSPSGRVVEVSHVHPQGKKTVYEVTLADGRSTHCCIDHLWRVYDNVEKTWKVIDTKELKESIHEREERARYSNQVVDRDYLDTCFDIYLERAIVEIFKRKEQNSHFSVQNNNILLTNAAINAKTVLTLLNGMGKTVMKEDLGRIAEVVMNDQYDRPAQKQLSHYFKVHSGPVAFTSIKEIGEEECQCITVTKHPDDEERHHSLYVTDDLIVTHNSIASMGVAVELNSRFLLIVRPKFVEKWVNDILRTLEVKEDELIVVQGSSNLKALLSLAKEDNLKSIKAIIISNRTFQGWIKQYETFEDEIGLLGWEYAPYDYAKALGCPAVFIDEGHLDFHLNFKILLYTHCQVTVTSTATLSPDQDFLKKISGMVYPKQRQFDPGNHKQYIDTYAVHYYFRKPDKIRSIGPQGYSHLMFEQSLMTKKNKDARENYIQLVIDLIKTHYLQTKKEGFKCLVFCATVNLATILTRAIAKHYEDLLVQRYCDIDPFEHLMESDICVSTLLSSGTAVDIPGLSTVILTTAISSSQSNLQALGRLREMKDGTTPRFLWLTNMDNYKHVNYEEHRVKLIKKMTRQHHVIEIDDVL